MLLFTQTLSGTNAYAILRTTKTDGAESIVLAASWKSREGDKVNVRGVATVLAIAKYVSRKFIPQSLWLTI